MPPRTAALLAVVIICVCAGFGAFRQPAEAKAANPTQAEKALIRAVNNAREHHGMRRLRIGSWLQPKAHRWARYLREHNAFYHGSLGSGVTENIAWLTCRDGWARTIVHMWLNSSSHRGHLLDRGARKLGAGVATGRWGGYRCVRIGVTRFR